MKSRYSCSACVSAAVPPSRYQRVGDRQLGAHLVLRIRIGIQQRLQVKTRHVEVAAA